MSDTISLTAEQLRFFEEQGYLALPALTTPEEVVWLREVYDRLFRERAGREEGNQFDLAGADEDDKEAALPQILNPAKYAPELNDSQLLKNATVIGKQLFGEQASCAIAHAIFKPARTGAATPWHQDAAYWNPSMSYRSVSIWVPLQEATPENGCMQFVPGSHRLDVVRHQSINNDPRVHGLELHADEMWRVRDAVECPLPAGGATFHGGYMLHHTAPNRSAIPRRALILGAGLPAEPLPQPRRFAWLDAQRTARSERAKRAETSDAAGASGGVALKS